MMPTARIIGATTHSLSFVNFLSRRSIASSSILFSQNSKDEKQDAQNEAHTSSANYPAAYAKGQASGHSSGGESLGSTASGAPSMPKVFNSSMPSDGRPMDLSEEQELEVKKHNSTFQKPNEPGQK
ncbi:hypothetical protein HJFPF1_10718 [Paramyrothecium foliicola]|nr:hypothetical protein HJFPF1_10718 [Paramyrothecium foliicola]